jgi:glycosyltransferase involved in cell wall biosynthesis
MAAGSEFKDRISFEGEMGHDETLRKVAEEAHIIIHPTVINETFGLSNVEGLSACVPIVTFGVGGVADYLRPSDSWGRVAKEASVKSLSAALMHILANLDDTRARACEFANQHEVSADRGRRRDLYKHSKQLCVR